MPVSTDILQKSENGTINGRIIKGIGGFYYVDTGEKVITCRARGKLRKIGITPYVGDIAEIDINSDGTGYILEIAERRNLMERPPISNIDQIVIVASTAPPEPDTYFIDRIAASAEMQSIPLAVAVNKCDEDNGKFFLDIYKNTNIEIFGMSAKTGEGISDFKKFLSGKLTALTGNSGVGKSTIINAISPESKLETGEINKKIGRGRHTTRHVELFKIEKNTWIADTPGFSAFDFSSKYTVTKENLSELFPEFLPYSADCRFTGCLHSKEEGCGVLEAVKAGKIERSRHDSYVRMLNELESAKKYK